MGDSTTGRRRREALLGAALLVSVHAGCDEQGPIDRKALEREASLPDSTAPELSEHVRDQIQVGDVYRIGLDVHCGVRYLSAVDGRSWEAVAVHSDFSGLELEYLGAVEGELQMVAADRIEFQHPKLRATFRPYEGDAAVGTCD